VFISPEGWTTFRSLLVPDLALAAATLTTALGAARRQLRPLHQGIVTGAWGYAALWTLSATWRGQLPMLDASVMVAGLVIVSYTCHAAVSQGATSAH